MKSWSQALFSWLVGKRNSSANRWFSFSMQPRQWRAMVWTVSFRKCNLKPYGEIANVTNRINKTEQSRFFESRVFEVPFRPSRCAVAKVVPMLRTEFRWSVYPHYIWQQKRQLRLMLCAWKDRVILQQISDYNFKSKLALKTSVPANGRDCFDFFTTYIYTTSYIIIPCCTVA